MNSFSSNISDWREAPMGGTKIELPDPGSELEKGWGVDE